MAVIVQVRRDTASNWTSANPILLAGELGFEYDTGKMKVGDGTTNWNSLPYLTQATGPTGGAGPTGPTGSYWSCRYCCNHWCHGSYRPYWRYWSTR